MSKPCFPSQLKKVEFTDEEVQDIWGHVKSAYIDRGVTDLESTINGVGRDLGLKPSWVADALARNKTTRRVTTEMYRKMSDRRYVVNQAKDYVKSLGQPFLSKALEAVIKVPFAAAVAGHGTVGMETHAGGRMFLPSTWNHYWPNFLRQWKLWLKPAYHEALMQELKRSENFDLFRRAGLANDPDRVYTDYGAIAKYAGLRGGQRGFDALKLYRQKAMEASWSRVPESIKADPVASLEYARGLAKVHNAATGTADVGSGPLAIGVQRTLFAAKLLKSKWDRVIGAPIETATTFTNWKNATGAERHVALVRLRNASEFAGTYVAALIANQALLQAVGSKQTVNLNDPSKSDWLKFKAFNHVIALDGGLLDPVRLLGKIVYGDLIKARTPFQQRSGTRAEAAMTDLAKYIRGKLTPSLGILTDEATGTDYVGRPVPRPLLPTEPAKYKDQPAYTPSEYILSHGPIPLSGGIREIYDSFREQGMTSLSATQFIRALGKMGKEEWAKAGLTTVTETTGAKASKDYVASMNPTQKAIYDKAKVKRAMQIDKAEKKAKKLKDLALSQ